MKLQNLMAIPNADSKAKAVSKENRANDFLVRTSFLDGRPMVLVERMGTTDVEAVFENSELGACLADELCERFNKGHVRI